MFQKEPADRVKMEHYWMKRRDQNSRTYVEKCNIKYFASIEKLRLWFLFLIFFLRRTLETVGIL